ncbi:MAG: DNA polymerase III subunit gamma/tau [Chloroflexota bacterium]
MSQALYRKWRPGRFEDVVGQEHITQTLQNSVASDRVGHAYLFCGPRGTGKTTSARLLAKAVNCLAEDPAKRPCNECRICIAVNEGRFLDLIEIDAASNTGVDDIRELREKVNFAPNEGRFKVYIIDEVHMLSTAAFNALLKTLEEPPAHIKFVLATTEEHKVPITIKSRCQQFNFRLFTVEEIESRLEWLAEKESFTIEPEALQMIAREGSGSLRDAESLLDQLVIAPGDNITAERTRMVLGTASNTAVIALTDAWLKGDGSTGLSIIHDALGSGTDARQFCRQMVAYLRQLILLQAAGQALPFDGTDEQKAEMVAQAQRAPRKLLISALRAFNEAAMTPAGSWQPQLPLELAFVEMLPDTAVPTPVVVTQTPPAQTAPVVQSKTQPSAQQPTPKPVPEPATEPVTLIEPPAKIEANPVVQSEVGPESNEADPIATETAMTTDLTISGIKAQWPTLIERASEQNRNLKALLNMGKPLATEGNTFVIGFDFPIFKEKFDNTQGANQLVGSILSNLVGVNTAVRTVVTSEYKVAVTKNDLDDIARELGGVVQKDD